MILPGFPKMMPMQAGGVEFIGAESVSVGGATAATTDVPAGVVDGDFLVAIQLSQTASTPSLIAGWDNVALSAGGAPGLRISSRVANSEPSSYSYSAGSTNKNLTILAFRGASAAAAGTISKVSSSTVSAPEITAEGGGILVAAFHRQSTSSTVSASPGGMDLQSIQNAAAPSVAIYTEESAPGLTGSRDLTWNGGATATASFLLELTQ